MISDKTLRGIWSITDQTTTDAMQDTVNSSHISGSTIKSHSFNKKVTDCKTSSKGSIDKGFKNQQFQNKLPYKNPISTSHSYAVNKEGGTDSLISIWTPTIKDDIIANQKRDKSLPNHQFHRKQPIENESRVDKTTGDCYETITDSESELSNNCGSDESQDECNEETFGKFAAVPDEFRPNNADLSELSEATASCNLLLENHCSNSKTLPRKDSKSSTRQTNVNKRDEMIQNVGCNNCKSKMYHRDNSSLHNDSIQEKRISNLYFAAKENVVRNKYHKPPPQRQRKIGPIPIHSKFSHLSLNSCGVLRHSQENLLIKEMYTSSKQQKSTPVAKFGLTRKTIEETLAYETHGNSHCYKAQTITYIQGKAVGKKYGKPHEIEKKQIVWNSDICISENKHKVKDIHGNRSNDNTFTTTHNNKHLNNNIDSKCSLQQFERTDFHGRHNKNMYIKAGRVAREKDSNTFKRYLSTTDENVNVNDRACFRFQKGSKGYFDKDTKNESVNLPKHRVNLGLFHEEQRLQTRGKNYPVKKANGQMRMEWKEWNGKNEWEYFEKANDSFLDRRLYKADGFENRRRQINAKSLEAQSNLATAAPKFVNQNRVLYSNKISNCENPIFDTIPKEFNVCKIRDCKSTTIQNNTDQFIFLKNRDSYNKSQEIENCSGPNTLPIVTREPDKYSFPEKDGILQSSIKLEEEKELKKRELINYGKEMADLIAGCQRGIDLFRFHYDEWNACRTQSIDLLEQMITFINNSFKTSDTIKTALSTINNVVVFTQFIPNNISLGIRIVTALGSFISKMVGKDLTKKDLETKEIEVKQNFQKDVDTTSMVYIYGVQCGSQFQETCKVIDEFHRRLHTVNFTSVMNDADIIDFMTEISEYNPSNISVFYKRLRLCYERLIENTNSNESRAFVRVFEDVPEALRVVDLLAWRFDTDCFDNSIVEDAWQELFDFFSDRESTCVDDFLKKIQKCLLFLKKEQAILGRSVLHLLNEKDLKKEKN